jgi:hypothetical protein
MSPDKFTCVDLLSQLPDELVKKVAWFMPSGGIPSRRLLILGQVCKSLRKAVRSEVQFQLERVHSRKYRGLKRSYQEIY